MGHLGALIPQHPQFKANHGPLLRIVHQLSLCPFILTLQQRKKFKQKQTKSVEN